MARLRSLRILLLSTPVGPLGSGLGGGVELTLQNIAKILQARGHTIAIAAPAGSVCPGFAVVEIPGRPQPTAQSAGRDAPVTLSENSVLGNLWEYAWRVQADYDLLLNFAYDWLPFYLTPFFQTAIAHLVSMGSLTNAMDEIIGRVAQQFPGTIGVHSAAQAATFTFAEHCRVLGNALDLSLYDFCPTPEPYLGWVGRLAPEKGLEDAIIVAEKTGIPLKIWGVMPDVPYWHDICDQYPDAPIHYEGFLPTAELQRALGHCQALLMTPHWVEAFGNVAIEALACGVPVIAYRRGGPAEIVSHGKTGWLVDPDSIEDLIKAVHRRLEIDRFACRAAAEANYSLTAMGDRLEEWFSTLLPSIQSRP